MERLFTAQPDIGETWLPTRCSRIPSQPVFESSVLTGCLPIFAVALILSMPSFLLAAPTQRVLLTVDATDRQIRANLNESRNRLVLNSSSDVRPIYYSFASSLAVGDTQSRWLNVPIGITNGPVEVDLSGSTGFYRAQFPDFAKKNGYLRVPGNLDLALPQTLVVFLHGDTPKADAGKYLESFIGDWFDDYGGLSWFPTSLASTIDHANWTDGSVKGPDHAYLEYGILACKRLIKTINRVVLVGYSSGAGEAATMTQLLSQTRPELVNALVVFAPTYDSTMVNYLRIQNGGKPIQFDPPIDCVTISSPGDEHALDRVAVQIAKEMARANGYTNAPIELLDRIDINPIPGNDTKVFKYGQHVRRLQVIGNPPSHAAPNHDDSQWVSDPGADMIYRDGMIHGIWPGND